MKNKATIIIAHGSPLQQANEDIKQLIQQVSQANPDQVVRPSFLSVGSPSLKESIEDLVDQNINKIDIIPYFLARGNHITKDIPLIVETMNQKYPSLVFKVLEPIGYRDEMLDLLNKLIQKD